MRGDVAISRRGVLGLALLPMSLGRWLPRRAEGTLLILLYAVYMVLWRWGTSIG